MSYVFQYQRTGARKLGTIYVLSGWWPKLKFSEKHQRLGVHGWYGACLGLTTRSDGHKRGRNPSYVSQALDFSQPAVEQMRPHYWLHVECVGARLTTTSHGARRSHHPLPVPQPRNKNPSSRSRHVSTASCIHLRSPDAKTTPSSAQCMPIARSLPAPLACILRRAERGSARCSCRSSLALPAWTR